MIRDFIYGIITYVKAARFVIKHRLWPWLAVPGFLSLVFACILVFLCYLYSGGLAQSLSSHIIPDFMKGDISLYLLKALVWIFLLALGLITYKQLALVLFSPILGYLSERTECIITGEEPPGFSPSQLIKDLMRSLVLNGRHMLAMLIFTMSAWLTLLIPLIGAITAPVLILLVQAYYGGCGLTDYTLERHRYSVKESIAYSKKHRGLTIGVGTGFILILLIPLAGWFTAPGLGSVAATMAVLEKNSKPSSPKD